MEGLETNEINFSDLPVYCSGLTRTEYLRWKIVREMYINRPQIKCGLDLQEATINVWNDIS